MYGVWSTCGALCRRLVFFVSLSFPGVGWLECAFYNKIKKLQRRVASAVYRTFQTVTVVDSRGFHADFMRTASLRSGAMNIDHFAAGGRRCFFPDAPQPRHTLPMCLFFLRFKKQTVDWERESKSIFTSYKAWILKRYSNIIETWKKYTDKNQLYWKRSLKKKKKSLTVRILRPFLLPRVEMHFRRVL